MRQLYSEQDARQDCDILAGYTGLQGQWAVDGASYHQRIDPSYVALYGHGPLYGNVNPKEPVADYHNGCYGLDQGFKDVRTETPGSGFIRVRRGDDFAAELHVDMARNRHRVAPLVTIRLETLFDITFVFAGLAILHMSGAKCSVDFLARTASDFCIFAVKRARRSLDSPGVGSLQADGTVNTLSGVQKCFRSGERMELIALTMPFSS